MSQCINPKEIHPGDLSAYVDGEASPSVRTHIARCAYCTAKALQIQRTSKLLFETLYRVRCPAPEVLGQYHLDLLSPDERLTVAAHVRTCPHCTQELELLSQPEDALIRHVMNIFKNVTQVVDAMLVAPLSTQPTTVRGYTQQHLAFRGADVDVLIGFAPTTPNRCVGTLTGTILQMERISDKQVWLFPPNQSPQATDIDTLGIFTFENITPGEYVLALNIGDQALLLREVTIDAA